VCDVTEGLREVPRREGVGAIALMDDGDCGAYAGVVEVDVEARDLVGKEQSLVDDGSRGEAREAERAGSGATAGLPASTGLSSNEIQVPLESVLGGAFAGSDEDLANSWEGLERKAASDGQLDGHGSPTQDPMAEAGNRPIDGVHLGDKLIGIRREEAHTDGVGTGCREGEAEPGGDGTEVVVGDLQEDAGAIPGGGIRASRSAVGKVEQSAKGELHDIMGALAGDIDDAGEAAGIVLERWIIEALPAGRSEMEAHRCSWMTTRYHAPDMDSAPPVGVGARPTRMERAVEAVELDSGAVSQRLSPPARKAIPAPTAMVEAVASLRA